MDRHVVREEENLSSLDFFLSQVEVVHIYFTDTVHDKEIVYALVNSNLESLPDLLGVVYASEIAKEAIDANCMYPTVWIGSWFNQLFYY